MLQTNDNVSLVCFSATIQHVRHVKATERQVYHRNSQRREPVLATRLPIVRTSSRFFPDVLRVLDFLFLTRNGTWRFKIKIQNLNAEYANNKPTTRTESEIFRNFTSHFRFFFIQNRFTRLFP